MAVVDETGPAAPSMGQCPYQTLQSQLQSRDPQNVLEVYILVEMFFCDDIPGTLRHSEASVSSAQLS